VAEANAKHSITFVNSKKNLDLNDLGVQEMKAEEMMQTEGGNLFTDIGKAIGNAVEAIGEAIGDAWDWLVSHGKNGTLVFNV